MARTSTIARRAARPAWPAAGDDARSAQSASRQRAVSRGRAAPCVLGVRGPRDLDLEPGVVELLDKAGPTPRPSPRPRCRRRDPGRRPRPASAAGTRRHAPAGPSGRSDGAPARSRTSATPPRRARRARHRCPARAPSCPRPTGRTARSDRRAAGQPPAASRTRGCPFGSVRRTSRRDRSTGHADHRSPGPCRGPLIPRRRRYAPRAVRCGSRSRSGSCPPRRPSPARAARRARPARTAPRGRP